MDAKNEFRELERLASACKALSHPARLAILRMLAQRGVCICGEIVDVLPLSQATVSQHLKIRKDAGLITGEIVAAYAEPDFIRSNEIDDQELVHESPLLAYLAPGRFATIERSNAFPFPANMKK